VIDINKVKHQVAKQRRRTNLFIAAILLAPILGGAAAAYFVHVQMQEAGGAKAWVISVGTDALDIYNQVIE
jgi:hypothetical protein